MISTYRPLLQNSDCFLNFLIKIIDYFANTYDYHLILGDFNLEPTNSTLMGFLDNNNLTNLIQKKTCFKGKGSCIDLVLTNRKFPFGQKKSCMFAVTRPSLLKSTHLKLFFSKIYKKLWKTYICLLKSQRFGSSVPFIVTNMV